MISKVIRLADLKNTPKDLVVYGGTFDPIHEGHLSVIKGLLKSFHKVLLAPTDQNPWKKSNATNLELRREMIRLVINAENLQKDTDISDISYVYTEEFITQLREDTKNSNKPIYWAIGEDSIESPPKWKNFDKLNLIVVAAPVSVDIHATQIRNGENPVHPALDDFVRLKDLY